MTLLKVIPVGCHGLFIQTIYIYPATTTQPTATDYYLPCTPSTTQDILIQAYSHRQPTAGYLSFRLSVGALGHLISMVCLEWFNNVFLYCNDKSPVILEFTLQTFLLEISGISVSEKIARARLF